MEARKKFTIIFLLLATFALAGFSLYIGLTAQKDQSIDDSSASCWCTTSQSCNFGGVAGDWSDNSYKYLPWFKKVGSGWVFTDYYYLFYSSSHGPAGHHYKDSNILKIVCKRFEKIYIDYYSYNG